MRIEKRGDINSAVASVARARNKAKTTVREIYFDHRGRSKDVLGMIRKMQRDPFRKVYAELAEMFGRADRDRIFGAAPARFAIDVARELRGASLTEGHDLVDKLRRIFPTK